MPVKHARQLRCAGDAKLSCRKVCCHATARGEGYYKKYLANRADRSGRLLPPSPEAEQLVPLRPLEQHVLQELWAYSLGLPSPADPLLLQLASAPVDSPPTPSQCHSPGLPSQQPPAEPEGVAAYQALLLSSKGRRLHLVQGRGGRLGEKEPSRPPGDALSPLPSGAAGERSEEGVAEASGDEEEEEEVGDGWAEGPLLPHLAAQVEARRAARVLQHSPAWGPLGSLPLATSTPAAGADSGSGPALTPAHAPSPEAGPILDTAPGAGQKLEWPVAGRSDGGAGTRPGVMVLPPTSPGPLEGPTLSPPRLPSPPRTPSRLPLQVFIFWDVSALHPGSQDPRLLSSHLLSFARQYGSVAGAYAYAVRKAWNWVPQAFLRYVRGSLAAGGSRGVVGQGEVVWRCLVCGSRKRSRAELAAHVRVMHPQVSQQGQGEGQGEGQGGGQGEGQGQGQGRWNGSSQQGMGHGANQATQGQQARRGAGAGAATGPTAPQRGLAAGGVRGLMLPELARNSYKRTLGRVHEYFTAAGQRLVPPVGHQVSLKYCLSQEGWEARIVQNSAASPSVAMASGMGRLLDRIRRGELASPGANSRLLVILCSDDEEGLQQPLLRMRGLGGAATLVVCSERHRLRQPDGDGTRSERFRGADALASWEVLREGRYAAPVARRVRKSDWVGR